MNSIKLGFFAIIACFISCVPSVFSAGIFTEIPGLSASAQSSLVAHYDGRTGVSTSNATSSVDSWTPVDGNGNSLPSMIVSSTARGTGATSLITYDGVGNLSFDDTATGSQGRYLLGALTNDQSTSFTVMWRGHYKADAPFQTSGTYAYNIGINDISHQRDDGGGGFRVELYNGTTYAGDDITAYDGTDTIWSTVITANSHNVYANGTNLNVGGNPTNSVGANADIIMGAYSGSGYDFVGDMSQMIIFNSALSDADRILVGGYLTSIPEPSVTLLLGLGILSLLMRRRRSR